MASENKNALVAFGEIMLRLDCPPGKRLQRTDHFNRYFGGAEANVSALLAQLGVPVSYVTALPRNNLGDGVIDELQSFGINTSFIRRGEDRLGIYFTEHGNNIRPGRVIYDRKNSAFASLQIGTIDWKKIFAVSNYFFWSGISASLTQNATDVCTEAINAARANNLTIAADMNYRRTLWDYGETPSQVMPELLSMCEIITGDIDTITVYFGIPEGKGSYEEKFRFCTAELKKRLPAMQVFAMSFRGVDSFNQQTYSGALLHENEFYFSPVYSLPQTADRIGSGDAFQAGLLYALIEKRSAQDIVNFAVSCGALKHSLEGDFAILAKEEIEQFIKNGPVNKVIR